MSVACGTMYAWLTKCDCRRAGGASRRATFPWRRSLSLISAFRMPSITGACSGSSPGPRSASSCTCARRTFAAELRPAAAAHYRADAAVPAWHPVVIAAAADELGSHCPPLVLGGQPSAAGWRLSTCWPCGRREFRFHGDFDWGGIRIASAVRQRVSQGQPRWQPWRYDRDAYEAAATAVLAVHAATRLPRLQASRSRPPGIRVWRPPWHATMFASRRSFPSTPCCGSGLTGFRSGQSEHRRSSARY